MISLFIPRTYNGYTILLMCVDDMIINGNNVEGIKELKTLSHAHLQDEEFGTSHICP